MTQTITVEISSSLGADGLGAASHLSRSALFLMVLSWLMALLFSMDTLAWLARISLLCLRATKRGEPPDPAGRRRSLGLSPLVDELQLGRLLLLVVAQQLLEELALLHDVSVLHLLLLVAVAADQLGPLLGVLRGDFLHLSGEKTPGSLESTAVVMSSTQS